jgi:hypothetical protein
MQISLSNNRLYNGSGLNLNSLGMGLKMGKNGALGFELASLDFGDIPITLTNSPAGTGGAYSPGFFQLGVGYSYTYGNKISVGALVRGISETVIDVSAFGFSVDAGVQYVSGEKDQFKLGIALRNVGSPMRFGGEGLSIRKEAEDYLLTYDAQAASFELPSMLNLGLSYDVYLKDDTYIRLLGNFTSNAFSKDQIGGGLEIVYLERISLRGGYKLDLGNNDGNSNIYTGLAGGISIDWPFGAAGDKILSVDYAYRTTSPFKGSHNFTLSYGF